MQEVTYRPVIFFSSWLIAIILMLLPMPLAAVWFRPAWILMVLVYWTMLAPESVSIGTAWLTGLLLDALEGTLLGEHALALTIVLYVVVRIRARLCMFPLVQQGLAIFLLTGLYQFILFCIQGFLDSQPH